MTTVHLAHPNARHPRFQVFASYEGPDDRYTFGFREFEATEADSAELAARLMIAKFRADHFQRTK